jgi:pimeloyl-ACP methyl ester carboxylesterase
MTTFVIHFGGLGHGKGEFGFLKSIEQSLAFVEEVAASERFDRLHLFGHSFGGLVALNAARKISESSASKLGDIFLVSPFSFVPSANETRALLASIRNSDADFPAALDIETAITEVELIGKRFNPREIAPQLKARRVFILQAKHDDEVPAQLNRLFAPMFQPEARYLEVDQDHSFTDRPALIKIVTDWLR